MHSRIGSRSGTSHLHHFNIFTNLDIETTLDSYFIMDFFDILKKHYGISEDGIAISRRYFYEELLPAGDFFVKAGEISNKLSIILKGLFRSWLIDDSGEEVTTAFHEPQTLLFCPESFYTHTPAKENIEALEYAELLSVPSDDIKDLYQKVPVWTRIIMDLSETSNNSLGQRNMPFQNLEAKERYKWFCKKHPHISEKAKPDQIASYLKIDPAHILPQPSK